MNFINFSAETKTYQHLARTIREDLHMTPELGLQEFETAKKIRNYLSSWDIPYTKIIETGTLVFFDFGHASTLAVRADIDGLPIQEDTNLPFQSRTLQRMHACGHDGHTTNLLLLAKRIKETKDTTVFQHNVLLIFQPAEEGPGGAKLIVESGIFETYNVHSIIGLHLFPGLPYGKIGARKGAMMAQNGELAITIHGTSSHGAQPHTGIDAITIAADLIQSYQHIASRRINPLEAIVITIGKIEGGDANNIIASTCTLSGTVRTFSTEVFLQIQAEMQKINAGLELQYGCQIDFSLPPMYPPVINDATLTQTLQTIATTDFVELDPYMLAEDFSYYQAKVPGLFFFLGTNDNINTHPLHSSFFNFNTDILLIGNEIFYQFLQKK